MAVIVGAIWRLEVIGPPRDLRHSWAPPQPVGADSQSVSAVREEDCSHCRLV